MLGIVCTNLAGIVCTAKRASCWVSCVPTLRGIVCTVVLRAKRLPCWVSCVPTSRVSCVPRSRRLVGYRVYQHCGVSCVPARKAFVLLGIVCTNTMGYRVYRRSSREASTLFLFPAPSNLPCSSPSLKKKKKKKKKNRSTTAFCPPKPDPSS
jgi:hypothetical protein